MQLETIAKYGIADHSTVELCHFYLQKNHSEGKEIVTNTSFTEYHFVRMSFGSATLFGSIPFS